MTYQTPLGSMRAVAPSTSRSRLTPITGNLAHLRTALTDKRALVARLEAEWVAAAEVQLARHLSKHIRIDDRGTWDGPTFSRYMLEAERIEPEFKPRIKRLLGEIDALDRMMSPSPTAVRLVA